MNSEISSEPCPVCGEGTWQKKSDGVYIFRHGRKEHRVSGQHYAHCEHCGTQGYLPGQREKNRLLIQAYQKTLPGYVSPSDVLAVREKYLLTQAEAARIFGGGVQGFSKWERGVASPAGPTARIIRLALKFPEVMRDLANDAGVKLAASFCKEDVRVRVVYVEKQHDEFTRYSGSTSFDSLSEDSQYDIWSNHQSKETQSRAYRH